MPNNKKNIILAVIFLLLILIVVGGWIYWQNKQIKNQPDNQVNNEVFKLLDDQSKLVYSEEVNLYPEARAQFEKKAKEAQDNINKSIDNDSLVANYNNLGLFNRYLGNYQVAYQAYINSLNTINDSRLTLMAFGELLEKMKAYKSAEAAFNRANELNPWESAGWLKLIHLYKTMGDNEAVKNAYKSALEKTQANVDSTQYAFMLIDYAEWLTGEKLYDQAISAYEKLIILQPNNKDKYDKLISNLKK